jgi:hypothetical protein
MTLWITESAKVYDMPKEPGISMPDNDDLAETLRLVRIVTTYYDSNGHSGKRVTLPQIQNQGTIINNSEYNSE